MTIKLSPQGLVKANLAFRDVEHAARYGPLSTHKVLRTLEKLTPEELGATLDFIQQGSDSINLPKLTDLFDHSSKHAAFQTLIAAPAVQAAFASRQTTPMVQSDVDQTLLDSKQRAIAGMRAVLDVLGSEGGSAHIISARVKALGVPTNVALQHARMQVNSTEYGTLKNFNAAGLAHLENKISQCADPALKAKLIAQREDHYRQVGDGKFDIAQQRMAANPGRKQDFLGDDVEGDMYLFERLLKHNDAGVGSSLGLVMLHIVDGKDLPQRVKDEVAKPDSKCILYKDAEDLGNQLLAKGRIDQDGHTSIVGGYRADVAARRAPSNT